MLTSASQCRSAAASLQQGEKKIRVYDLRLETEAKTFKLFKIAGRDFNDFLQALHKVMSATLIWGQGRGQKVLTYIFMALRAQMIGRPTASVSASTILS